MIAPSFADIFRNNCFKVGLLPVELPRSPSALMDAVLDDPATEITVDLDALRASARPCTRSFEIDPYTRWRLLEGLDDIDLTLRHAAAIDAYERARPARLPSVPALDPPANGPRPTVSSVPAEGRCQRAMSSPSTSTRPISAVPKRQPPATGKRCPESQGPNGQPLRRESDGWLERWMATVEDLARLKASHPMLDAVIDEQGGPPDPDR